MGALSRESRQARGCRSVYAIKAGEKSRIFIPIGWRWDQSRRGIIYCHGAGADAEATATANKVSDIAIRTGCIVAVPDLAGAPGGQAGWANPNSVAKVADHWGVLTSEFGVKTDRMLLLGLSMGAATALVALLNPDGNASLGASKIKALVLENPAISIDDIHDNNRLGQQAPIATAYGGSPAWETAKASRDPHLNRPVFSALNGGLGVPMQMWYGGADPVCLPQFVETFAATVPNVSISNLGAGVGHDNSLVDPAARAAFLRDHSA